MPGSNREATKVIYINTEYVQTDATSFKSVVQKLTGKDAVVGSAFDRGSGAEKPGGSGGGRLRGGGGCSSKDFDKLLVDLPNWDEFCKMFPN